MALEFKLSQKMLPQLVMTPQLQQAIKLLQLSHLDLQQRISEELQENPALEEGHDDEETGAETVREPEATPEMMVTDRIADWQDYLDNHSNSRHDMVSTEVVREEADFPSLENTVTRRDTLQEHLLWQLRMAGLDEAGESIGMYIIGNLDERGYLEASVGEIGERAHAAPDAVEEVLAYIRLFDPVGIAARDLRECLLVQLHNAGMGESVAAGMVANHLHELEYKQYDRIAAGLNVGLEEVIEAAHLIGCLEPKPARGFDDDEVRTIIPDVVVQKVAGEYAILLNDDGVPPLRVSSLVRRLAGERGEEVRKAKEYLETKVRAATWLIKSIQWRQQTLYRVSESIFPVSARVPRSWHRRPQTIGVARGRVGNRHARVHGQPCHLQQVCPYTAGRFRVEVLLSKRDSPQRQLHGGVVGVGSGQDQDVGGVRGSREAAE